MFAIVLAMDVHGLIGVNNDLPWHFPEDLKYFKRLTENHKVLMGRKTFDSIYKRLGKPLPKRENIVLTRKKTAIEGCLVINDLKAFLNKNQEDKVFIIGGKQIFEQSIDYVDELYITHVKHLYKGDTFMAIDFSKFSSTIIKETDDLIFAKYVRKNR